MHAQQALGFQVDGDHPGQLRLGFEDMAGLAARRTAGIQHPLAGCQVEQVGSQLCGFVLDADPAFGKAWQVAHVAGCVEHDAIAAVVAWLGGDGGFT